MAGIARCSIVFVFVFRSAISSVYLDVDVSCNNRFRISRLVIFIYRSRYIYIVYYIYIFVSGKVVKSSMQAVSSAHARTPFEYVFLLFIFFQIFLIDVIFIIYTRCTRSVRRINNVLETIHQRVFFPLLLPRRRRVTRNNYIRIILYRYIYSEHKTRSAHRAAVLGPKQTHDVFLRIYL